MQGPQIVHRVQKQGDEQGIGGEDEYIDDDHAHGHDDVEVREQPGRGPGAFHQRLVGEEKEEADDTAGQEHRDDAGIEPAQAFALIQPGIDEDGAQAIEGHAGIVRLVQQLPDGRIRGQMALEQDEIDEHDEPGLPVDPLPAHIFQIKGPQRDAGIDAQGQGAHHGVIPGEGEDHEAHNQQLHHHGRAADDGDVYLADAVEQPENGISVPRPLLVVGGSDHGNQNAEKNAQGQRQGRDQQGGADAV